MIAGEEGISIIQDRYSPRMVAMPPTIRPIRIREDQFCENNAEMEAGIIRKANIVKIPPTLTASTITIPKLK